MIENSKSKIRLGFMVALFIVVGIFSASMIFDNTILKNLSHTANITEAVNKQDEKPKYAYFIKDEDQPLRVSAEAYLVGDIDTGNIILSKNHKKELPIASISKLMTALVADELQKETDIVKISKTALATYGGNGGLKLNEQIKVSDLIYPLILESSNDAAEALAEHFKRDSFVSAMNQKAEKIGMSSTFFNDPSGLSPENKSTALDIFKLIEYLKQNKQELLKITTARSYSNKNHNWSNTSQFLKKEGYLGGKSGFIDESLQTVVSVFSLPLSESGSRPIAIALLRSKDRKKDVETILNYLEKNIYYGEISKIEKEKEEAEKKVIAEKPKKEEVPEIIEPDFVNLAFAGDIMMDRGVESSVMKNFNGDFSALFEKLDILKESDIVFANLEGPASDKGADGRNLYSFRMSPSVIPALGGAGISIVSVANNHMADWGRDAFTDTLLRLKENEILFTGGGLDSREAESPTIIEKHGIKIGFLGFSDKGPHHMTTGESTAGVLLASNPRFKEIIKNASTQVDYLVVSFHFGEEYQFTHDKRQESLAYSAIDNGAKIVIGHHPHVVQDTEVYKNGYIAYSLGNFIFDQGFRKETMEGMLLQIRLSRDGAMAVKKNIVKLNRVFQPDFVIEGKEEKVEFKEPKIIGTQ